MAALIPNTSRPDAKEAARAAAKAAGFGLERRRRLRGLVLMALVLVLASFARAGWARVFYKGWWR